MTAFIMTNQITGEPYIRYIQPMDGKEECLTACSDDELWEKRHMLEKWMEHFGLTVKFIWCRNNTDKRYVEYMESRRDRQEENERNEEAWRIAAMCAEMYA